MRIRRRAWARPELDACDFYIQEPKENKGNWENQFVHSKQPLHIELGCGKGTFLAELAVHNPNINYLGVDIKSEMLGFTKRNIETVYQRENKEISNVKLFAYDIERILDVLDAKDTIERIYINFCNPWPRAKHHKKRLTHTRQLEKYKTFSQQGARIYFKTDDDLLFQASLRYFEESGYTILQKSLDLHQDNQIENIETEHEKMFSQQGIKIKALVAQL